MTILNQNVGTVEELSSGVVEVGLLVDQRNKI